MTTKKHTPILFGAPRAAATINAPLGQLDAAIVALEDTIAGVSQPIAVLTGTANSGQKVLPYTGAPGAFIVGMPLVIGDVGGTFEVGVIASIQAAVSLTVVTNLTNTYAAGKLVSASPLELVAARAGYATLTARLDDTSGTSGTSFPGSPTTNQLRRRTDRGGALYIYTGAAWAQVDVPNVTAFWGTPSTNDRAFRTDLRGEYFYDGTRWLSATLSSDTFIPADSPVTWPLAAGLSGALRLGFPSPGTFAIWVESVITSFRITTGGTALDAANKWVGLVTDDTGAAVAGPINIDSGASNAWRASVFAVNAVKASTFFEFGGDWTKTGTPGTLRALMRLNYRVIAT